MLKFSNFIKSCEVRIYANDYAIGGALMQNGHPIALENNKLYGTQLRWPTHEKELYNVVYCLKTWQHY
jgi:hypothetical protein